MGLFDYRKSLYKNFNEELHEKEINRLNELDTSLINRWNTTAEKGINRINNMYIPSLPSKNDFPNASTVPLPKYGYSQAKRNEVKDFVPNVVDTDTDIKKYLPKRYKKTKDGKQVEVNYLDSLKKEGKKEADRLTKKVSDNRKNKLYTNVVEPLVMGGLIEPAADIGSIFTLDKEGKKEYNKNIQAYKDDLSGVGKVSNTIGSIGANIGMSNALGLDKLKLANNKYLNSAIREGLENTIIESGLDLAKGNTDNFVKNRVGDFTGGAAFGVGANALGDMVRGIKNIDGKLTKNVNDIFDTSEVPNMDLDDNLTNINNKAKDIRRKQEELLKEKNTPNLSDVDFKYDDRTFEDLTNVGNRKVKSITENMYELKPFIQNQAEMILQDIRFGTVGGDTAINKATNSRATTSRLQSETFDIIKSQTGKSYAEIKEALKKVAKGEINDALTKKIELILDDSLINGTRLADGLEIPANNDYIETKKLYEELSKGNLNALNKPTNTFNSSNINLPLNDKNSIESLLGAKDNINNKTYVEAMNKSDDIFPNEVRKIQNETALTELEDKGLSRHKEITAANSDMVADEVKDFMSKYELDYDIKHDKDVIKKAMEEVKKPKAVENFLSHEGKPSAEYVATGEALFKELQSKGDIEGAVNVLNKLSKEGTNLGQSMRMYRLMNGLTPEGKLMYAQRQINNISDEIVKKNNLTNKAKEIAKKTDKKEIDVLKELKKKYKVPELTTKDSEFILDTMKKANETTNERQKEILIGKVNKLISEKIPSKGMEKFDSYRYLNMLFNPKTIIKNVGGNVVNATVGAGRDTIGSFVDNIVSKKTGVRTTGVGKSGYFDGLKKGAKETLEDHKLGIDTSHGAREGSKAAALRNIPVLGKAEKLMRTGLQLGDRPFYEGAKQNFINNYMKLNNIDDISKIPGDVLEEAHKVGLEATYQQNTALGDAISSLKNKKGVIGAGTKAILPFSQTPSAILDTAINYTPIGAIKGASNINKALKGVDVLSNQRKGVNQLASGILGTGLMYGGYKAAEKGALTGDLADDYDTRQLQLQTGMQPYAAKVGDTYNSLEFAQPGATPLMMGADMYQNKSLDSVLNTALNSVLSNSYLSGLTDLASKVNKRDGTTGYGAIPKEILKQYGTQSLPFNSLANQINKTIDNTKKDTYSKDEMERFKNQAMSKYPGLSQQLPTKLDSVGQEMQWNEGMSLPMQIFNNFFNPSTMSKFEPNKFEKNALDMYNKTGDTSQIPNMPTDSFGYGGYSEYKPTAEEQRLYSTMLANYLSRAENSVEGYSKAKKDAYEEWKAKLVKDNNLKKKPKKKAKK